jgi:glutaminyl-peptide cyclotransferase
VLRLRVDVLTRHPHDPKAFTQGLELDGDVLYESTGLYGESSVRVQDVVTGKELARRELDDTQWGEGLTLVDDSLVVLTWREHVAHVLDAETLEPRRQFEYPTEGWGVCDDGDRLVMSDGTSTLRFRDRDTFVEIGSVEVTLEGTPLAQLNELECVDGHVYANVWHTDTIVRIDPDNGEVRATIDASGLLTPDERPDPEAVLNGIAHDAKADTFFLTGKWWPAMFEVRFVPA